MPKKKKYVKGGEIEGKSHKEGGKIIEVEGGEYIIKKDSVKKIGVRNLNALNKTGSIPKKLYGGPVKKPTYRAGGSPKRYRKGGSAGKSIKTYNSGGYTEGK